MSRRIQQVESADVVVNATNEGARLRDTRNSYAPYEHFQFSAI